MLRREVASVSSDVNVAYWTFWSGLDYSQTAFLALATCSLALNSEGVQETKLPLLTYAQMNTGSTCMEAWKLDTNGVGPMHAEAFKVLHADDVGPSIIIEARQF